MVSVSERSTQDTALEGRRTASGRVFRVALPHSERRALLLLGDALIVNGSVLGAFYLWARLSNNPFNFEFVQCRGWYWFPILTALWWFLARLADLYDIPAAGQRLETTRRVGIAGLSLMVVYLAAYFLLPRNQLPRLFFLFFVGMALAGIVFWRWIYATVFKLPAFRHHVLIAGAGWAGRTIAQVLAEYSNGDYHAVGFVDDDPSKQRVEIAGLPVLGESDDLLALARSHRVDQVIVAVTHQMRGELFQALMDCRAAGVHTAKMPVLYEQLTRRVPVEHIGENWVIESPDGLSALGRTARAAKRLLDIVLGLLGALVLVIILPFVALAVMLDCPGPIFYSQVRAGLAGRSFRLLKFRTMIPSAERDGQAKWAARNDSRVTRVGRFLRRTRLDELPQVFNVLRGEMSIVGPRPERPEFIAELQERIPFYRTRQCVKPGLTGWAQVRYGYGNSVEDALIKLQYDLYYIRHWSLWLDLYVVFRTIGVVLRGGGT